MCCSGSPASNQFEPNQHCATPNEAVKRNGDNLEPYRQLLAVWVRHHQRQEQRSTDQTTKTKDALECPPGGKLNAVRSTRPMKMRARNPRKQKNHQSCLHGTRLVVPNREKLIDGPIRNALETKGKFLLRTPFARLQRPRQRIDLSRNPFIAKQEDLGTWSVRILCQ